jgi:Tol biopolymer transport system component
VSPDGASVAFVAPASDGVFQLFTVPTSGGAVRQITPDPVDKTQPAWSPDGKWIAYTRWEYRVDFLLQAPERAR